MVTSNLQIIKNNKLRRLFTKGPKYRENYNILWEKGKASITERPYGVTNMTLINLSAQNGRKKSEAKKKKK